MNLRQKNEQFQEINPFQAFAKFVNDNPSFFLKLLKEQMYAGKNGKGKDTGAYMSKKYGEEKYKMNPGANGRVDLFYTGDFYDGQFLKVKSTKKSMSITFYSTDEKADDLTEYYSIAIWTFNKETLEKAKYEIIKKFKDYLL